MSTATEILWYLLAALSVVVFLYGALRLVARSRAGVSGGTPPASELLARVAAALGTVFSHRKIGRRRYLDGALHAAVFYGWIALLIGTIIIAIQQDFTDPLFGVRFFKGDFYLAYKAVLNLLGTALVAGLLAMMLRRAVFRPTRLSYDRPVPPVESIEPSAKRYQYGDWVFVVTLLVIAITGFVLEGARLEMEQPGFEIFQFGGWAFAGLFGALSLSDHTLAVIRHGLWWFHGLLAITLVATIPYTKAGHMLTGFVSLVLRNDRAGASLPGIPADRSGLPAGYGSLADFSVLHLLNLDSCTRCGKCHEVCPAQATGLPLSPRDVVLDLHAAADQRWEMAGIQGVLGSLMHGSGAQVLSGGPAATDVVKPETAWSCMQCNACVDICPVGIEQAPIINQLRRRMVEEGTLEDGLQQTLQVIQKSGNSLGVNKRRRGKWTNDLDFDVKDARKEPVDVLWFVGDYASFDPRSQEISRTVARLFNFAGLDFGLLYEGERNSGNDVRRVGEEGLFELLAQENIAQISDCQFNRIVTTDPHSLNTLRNEYPEFGGKWSVSHHTEVLLELVESGDLPLVDELGYRVTYHDPCFLGRHNGVYDAPRELLVAIGCELAEMPRNRANSFCCGAGGGRIWMSDEPGVERPSEARIREALAIEEPPDLFVVSCPKDVTMYEDAIKTTANQDRLRLAELAELVALAVGLPSLPEPIATS